MAEQTSSSTIIAATPDRVMAVIADFDSYPEWADAVKEVEVLSVYEDSGRAAEVHFVLNAGVIKDDYRLSYVWENDHAVRWSLIEGKVLKKLDGSYTLKALDAGQTEVTYQLIVDVTVPMIGMIKRKAEKVIIDTALKELKKRVENN